MNINLLWRGKSVQRSIFQSGLFYILAALFVAFTIVIPFSFAAEPPCGNIIAPGNWEADLWLDDPMETVPIVDCDLPFGEIDEWSEGERKMLFTIEESLVHNGDVFAVLDGRTKKYDFEYNFAGRYSQYGHVIFRHQNNNYEYVDIWPLPLTEVDYRELAIEFGVAEENVEEYVTREMSDNPYEGLVRNTPEYIKFDKFDSFVWDAVDKNYPYLEAGTYTIVYHLYEYDQASLRDKKYLASRHADTFTITNIETEPTGASSVLFLPGIQASRLYTEDTSGNENQLWEPNRNEDLQKLEMYEDGFSVNEVYTKDVIDEIALPVIGGNVYKSFLGMLEDLAADKIIKDFLQFAYDWRYSVDDIVVSGTRYKEEVKGIIDEIEALADESYTKKVTIVAHSNGGLLAKAAMLELELLGKADLVDKVVLIGTPQVGTPKALGVILHGLDQQAGGGLIMDDVTAREVVRNMAGPYGLLPTESYFELVNEAVVLQDDSFSTEYLDEYGTVDSHESMLAFLRDDSNTRLVSDSINVPSEINEQMLDKALNLHEKLNDWRAPSDTSVFEIVGVGIPTIKAFEYREFGCSSYFGGVSCLLNKYSKPYPIFTTYGDETVVANSASAYEGNKFTGFVNLFEEGEGLFNKRYQHVNLTESPTIQEYLDSILKFGYQNETLVIPPEFISSQHRYKIVGVHSPVDILISDSSGKRVGIKDDEVYTELPGGNYFTLGDSKYVIVQDGEYEVELEGYATSTFSLTIDELDNNEQASLTLNDLPTSPEMKATFILGEDASEIEVDLDGDGQTDLFINPNTGEIVSTEQEVVDEVEEKEVNSSSSGTRVMSRAQPLVLGVSTTDVGYDEEYRELILQLLSIIEQYLALIQKR